MDNLINGYWITICRSLRYALITDSSSHPRPVATLALDIACEFFTYSFLYNSKLTRIQSTADEIKKGPPDDTKRNETERSETVIYFCGPTCTRKLIIFNWRILEFLVSNL